MQVLSHQEQIDEVLRLRDEEQVSFVGIAERLGFSEKTARRRYTAGTIASSIEALDDDSLEDFPEKKPMKIKVESDFVPDNQKAIERFKPLVRKGDAMVTCDFHIPLHDSGFVNVLVQAAKKNKVKKLIIGGDTFHQEAFSSYLPHQPEASLETERYEGNLVVKTLLRTFDEIDIIWGNHDFRLTKALGYKYSFTECMKWLLGDLTESEMDRIRFSDLDYMEYFPEKDEKFRICHPRDFSSTPLAVARKLAQKHDCHVLTAHSHHFAFGMAPNGRHLCIEGGGFFMKTRTEYIQKSTTHHEWTQGFTMFKDGLPHFISPLLGTDRVYRR